MKKSVDLTLFSVVLVYMINDKEGRKFSLQEDMERNPEMYKEYVEEDELVEPERVDLVNQRYIIVDNRNCWKGHEGQEIIGSFLSIDDSVAWAEINLDHNAYNVYRVQVVH